MLVPSPVVIVGMVWSPPVSGRRDRNCDGPVKVSAQTASWDACVVGRLRRGMPASWDGARRPARHLPFGMGLKVPQPFTWPPPKFRELPWELALKTAVAGALSLFVAHAL